MAWKPAGVISGAVSPFNDEGGIDWDAFSAHLHHLAGAGFTGLLVNASMAEGGHLTPGERAETLSFAVREIGDRVPVLATVYGSHTAEAAEEARRAAGTGARGLLVYPHPAFGGEPLEPELPAAYFAEIWRAAGLPMIVFRTPASLAPTLDLPALLRLSEHPGVVAVKDSTGDLDFYAEGGPGSQFLAADSPLRVLADHDPLLLPFLRAGAHGATVISSVVDPERYVELFDRRHTAAADRRFARVLRFAHAVYAQPFRDFRARLKEALHHDGVIATTHVRPPLLRLPPPERDRVIRALTASRAHDDEEDE